MEHGKHDKIREIERRKAHLREGEGGIIMTGKILERNVTNCKLQGEKKGEEKENDYQMT